VEWLFQSWGIVKCAVVKKLLFTIFIRAMKFTAALLLTSSLFAANAIASDAPAKPAAPAVKAAKPDLNAGAAKYAAVCASCHNADGNSAVPDNPKLAAQHPEYLIEQLQEFKSKKRTTTSEMAGIASALTDDEMRNIAYWLSVQKITKGLASDKETVALGEKIYKGGIADRQIPACAGCHSPTGAGIPSQYPRLSKQHAKYTTLQLMAFRDGTRKNSALMSQVAAKLNDKEIKAVADYMAGLR
jgi:cytochrome c553